MRQYSAWVFAALTAAICKSTTATQICAGSVDYSYNAAPSYMQKAVDYVKQTPVATWYTDRGAPNMNDVFASCKDPTSPPVVVVYGLPGKDCAAGFSSGGTNQNLDQYKAWLQTLTSAAKNRPVVYIVEPDAVGLLAENACAAQNNYAQSLGVAIDILSANPNAILYLDVGFWTLGTAQQADGIAKAVTSLDTKGRLRGIAINTSNYRSTSELQNLCAAFKSAASAHGKSNYKCVFDTSRNFNGPSPHNEWCNTKTAGIGKFPTTSTGLADVDMFLWIKPPGASDGQCTGQSSDAMIGPNAGAFFEDFFISLWNQGFPISQGYPKIIKGVGYDGAWPTGGSTPSQPAPAPAPTVAPAPAPTVAPAPKPAPAVPTMAPAPVQTSAPAPAKTSAPATTTTHAPAPAPVYTSAPQAPGKPYTYAPEDDDLDCEEY